MAYFRELAYFCPSILYMYIENEKKMKSEIS